MSVTANGPDGSTFSFPDGTPQEVVRRTLGKHYGWPDAQPQQRPTDAADPWAQFTPAPGQHPPPGADPWAQFKLAPQANAPPAAPARMPIFRVQGPDGSLYNVEAPDAESAVAALHGSAAAQGSSGRGGSSAEPASGDIDHSWPARLADNMRSVANGATLGASPRIAAALEAATGIGGDFGDYSGNLARRQDTERAYAQAHPVLSGIGNLTGNVAGLAAVGAVPGVAAALPDAAPTMLGKIGQGAAGGAAVGAVQGVNDAPDWSNVGDTVDTAAKSAGMGAALGGIVPLGAAAVGKSYSALADALRGYGGTLSRPAGKVLAQGLSEAAPGDVDAALKTLGPDAMLVDAAPSLLGKGQGALGNSAEARNILASALKRRESGAPTRLAADTNENFGTAVSPTTATRDILDHRSTLDAQNYGAALGDAAPAVDAQPVVDLIDDHLKTAVGEQKKALTRLRAEIMEPNPDLAPIGAPAEVPTSNARKLHGLKMELDNVIEHDQPGLGVQAGALKSQNRSLTMARGAINDALESQVPGYARANAISAPLAKRAEAVASGTKLLGSGPETPWPVDLAAQRSTMTPGERAAQAMGLRGRVEEKFARTANDVTAGKAIAGGLGDFNRGNLSEVFGQEPTDRFIAAVDREKRFGETHNRLIGNSETDPRAKAAAAMAPAKIGTIYSVAQVGLKAVHALTSPAIKAILPDITKSYPEVARALSAQGPERDAVLRALRDHAATSGRAAVKGQSFGNRAALAAALLANGALHSGPKASPKTASPRG